MIQRVRLAAALVVVLSAAAAPAQQTGDPGSDPGGGGAIITAPLSGPQGGFVNDPSGLGGVTDSSELPPTVAQTREAVANGTGGVVRWLDKVSGRRVDIALAPGEEKTEGRLTIRLRECRYPVDDPSSNAYAYLTVRDNLVSTPIFEGWMIASSPALNPLDSPRYDVWLLRCTTS